MVKHIPNTEFRGRTFYYRASFTPNRKTFTLRLSLGTADPVVAAHQASRLDLILKRRWRDMTADTTMMTDDDKLSIMRAAALQARDSLCRIEAGHLATRYDEPDEGQHDYRRSLGALQTIVRDIYLHGLHRDFGTRQYEMHLLEQAPSLDRASLDRLRAVIEGGDDLASGFEDRADEALRKRNVDVTSANVASAAREIAKGTLLALREAIVQATDPAAALDELLSTLEMPAGQNELAQDRPADRAQGHAVRADAVSIPATPAVATAVGPLGGATAIKVRMTVKDAAAAFLAAHPKYDDDSVLSVWTPKTRSQFETAVFIAYKFFGDTDVTAIDEQMLADLVRALRRLPANHHKTPAHAALSLAEIAERGVGATLGIATINRHVRFLKLVFLWAWKRAGSPRDVDWAGFIATDKRLKRDRRPAFTADELQTLFSGAVWHGYESEVRRMRPGPRRRWDSAYWVPLLLAYTGARREEISKLATADIERIEDVWAIRIRINAGGRLKNPASERDIPVADELIRLKFVEFVAAQHSAGEEFLFPELRRTSGGMGDVFYKKWWRALERAGLVPVGKDMHSIRHYVSTALAAAGVSEERRADLLGHTMASETAGTYTKRAPMILLKDVVNLIPCVTKGITSL